jgi:nucleotide-binding universal stress UspA family protein
MIESGGLDINGVQPEVDMKLMIAYDGSEHAKAAIYDLRRSGIPNQVTALVMTVGEPSPPAVGTPSLDPTIARRTGTLLAHTHTTTALSLSHAEELAQEGAALVADTLAGCEVTTHVRLGKPAAIIIDSAQAWGADLIVVGAQGRSALGRLLIGSVSQQVATQSLRSVLVARQVVDRRDNPVRLIVGIDGSPSSHAAIHALSARAWNDRTEVRIVAIAGTHRPTSTAKRIPTAAAWIDASNHSQRDTVRAALAESTQTLEAAGLIVSGHYAEGGPQRILNDHATEYDADCIFVGGHSFSGTHPGTDTAAVINSLVTGAPCSVEIVR